MATIKDFILEINHLDSSLEVVGFDVGIKTNVMDEILDNLPSLDLNLDSEVDAESLKRLQDLLESFLEDEVYIRLSDTPMTADEVLGVFLPNRYDIVQYHHDRFGGELVTGFLDDDIFLATTDYITDLARHHINYLLGHVSEAINEVEAC